MKFRISAYKDGNGKLMFRPEYRCLWWYKYFVYEDAGGIFIEEFDTYEAADKWVDYIKHEIAAKKRNRIA